MTSHRSLLRASLLAIAAPVIACGGSTTDDTGSTGTAGAGGGSAGSSTAGASNGGKAGMAGSTTAGTGGSTTAGNGGASMAGTGGAGSSGVAGQPSAGKGGSTGGSAGKAIGGSGGGTAGSAGKMMGGSGGAAGKSMGGAGGSTAGAGGTMGGAGGSMAGAGGGGSKTPFPCTNPVPIVVGGKDTGYDTCGGGETRRRDVVDCPNLAPRADACVSGVPTADTCSVDADCTAMPHGFCSTSFNFGPGGCQCQYGCVTDSDCGAGNVCVCGDPVGTCRPASCTGPSDCGEGDCTSYDASLGCGLVTFKCQTAADTCGGDTDCVGDPLGNSHCGFAVDASGVPANTRSCVPGGCAIGRPLFVDEAIRTSVLASRSDWA